MRLISLKPHRYASRSLKPGDSFDAREKDAKLLIKLGRASIDPADEPVVEAPRAKRKYKRRDMTAES